MEESNRQKWERYIQNLRRVRTLSRPQFPPETAPEFLLEAIQGNAVRCFDLMKENNALLGELVYTRDAKTLSDSDIAELEEAAGRLFNYANSEDCGVAYKIHELLLKAARFRDDVPMIVRELYYNGITLHYINVRDEDHDVNLLWPRIHAFFLEGANYIARYEELDKETRQYIIRCVGNIRLAVSRQTKEDCHRYMELFDLAMSIITSPYYQELDPDIPWARFTYSMHLDQMTLMAYLRHCNDPEVAERVLRSASYVYEHQKKNAGEESRQQNWRVSYFYHAALYHAGKGTARAVVEDLLEIISQTGEQDYSPDGINRNLTGAAYLFYYEAFLSEQDRAELADRIAKERAAAHRYLDEMPGNEYPRVASVAIRELITAQSDTKEIDNRKILESILSGHKPTYVHSTMVAHLTRVLLRRMIETDPAALIGLLGCKTAAEVQARKPELHGVGVGYGFNAPQLFLSRQNIVQRNALVADTVLILRHHPLLKSSKGIPNHVHHGVADGRSRIGQELHSLRCIELRYGLPQAQIARLFQIVRVKVQARLCQIYAAKKVICHLANKGLVVVDQAVQRGSIAFLCQRTKPFIRLLHGRFPALRQTAGFPTDRSAAVPVLPAWLLPYPKRCPTLHLSTALP